MTIEHMVNLEEIPSKKLGVKYLDDTQLTNSFPDWRALLQRIEDQRDIAKSAANEQFSSVDIHSPQMYDNLYAILGGRGAGKSSVVLTLRNKLMIPRNQNILFPIITPEVIVEHECSILGWIMSATEIVLTQLEQRVRRLEKTHASTLSLVGGSGFDTLEFDGFFENCQFKKDNELRKKYQELFKRSVQTSGKIDTLAFSTEDAIGYRVEQSRRQYKLIQDLNHFWQHLTKAWHSANCLENGGDGLPAPPLIILIFDDIDLVPERSMELLNTTFQYLTNPNIVIILTAAEKVLQDVIHLKMLERMIGSDSHSLLLEALPDSVKKATYGSSLNAHQFTSLEHMASEYYDKVIPPSSRYRLRRYQTIEEKLLYHYSIMAQSFTAPPSDKVMSIPICKFLTDQIDRLVQAFRDNGGASSNFLLGGPDGETFRRAYLIIFGDKSRNIANGCLEIMNSVTRLCNLAGNLKPGAALTADNTAEILQAMRHLLQALLHSVRELNAYADLVYQFLTTDSGQSNIIVNYNLILKCYQIERQEIKDELEEQSEKCSSSRLTRMENGTVAEIQQKMASLLTVLFFIDRMLTTMNKQRKMVHGYRVLLRLLEADAFKDPKQGEGLHLFPQNQDVEHFLDYCPLVLEHIHRYVNIHVYDLQFAQMYLKDNFHARIRKEDGSDLCTILSREIQQEKEWVKAVATMLAIRYSGITLVNTGFWRISGDVWKKVFLFAFMEPLLEARKRAAQDFLSNYDLLQASSVSMREWRYLMRQHYDWQAMAGNLRDIFSQEDHREVLSLQQCFDLYQKFVSEHQSGIYHYLTAYTAQRWNEYTRSYSMTYEKNDFSLSYTLVHFVDESMEHCMRIICDRTYIFLTKNDLNEIAECLLRIDDTSDKLRHLKNNLASTLKMAPYVPPVAEESDPDLNSPEEQLSIDDIPSALKEDVWRIPAAPFIDYMAELRDAVNRQEEQEYSNPYSIYDRPDLSGYFDLINFLTVSLKESGAVIRIGGVNFPLAGSIILDLNMVKFLLPFYFAAKMQIAIKEQDYDMYRNADSKNRTLDDKLWTQFVRLNAESQAGKPLTALQTLFKEARQELAQSYFSYLEEME